jgi:predicted MPP superfamily phosphohydrolase
VNGMGYYSVEWETMITRRKFIRGVGLAGAGAMVPVVHGLGLESNRQHVSLWKDGGEAVRIGHLSDFHSSAFVSLRHIGNAIDLMLTEKPDVVCITGDFVNDEAPEPDGLVNVLRTLTAAVPTFACLGNHDGGRWSARRGGPKTPDAVAELLVAANVRVLRDETEWVRVRDRQWLFTGVQDLWSGDIDVKKAGFTDEDFPRIVLAHNPDTKDVLARVPWDLMLSGHTHGGQIRFPFFGGRLTAP